MVDYQKQEKEEAKQRQQENENRFLQQMAEKMKTNKTKDNRFNMSDEYDMKIKMLRKILSALRGEKIPEDCKIKPKEQENVLDLRSAQYKKYDGNEEEI